MTKPNAVIWLEASLTASHFVISGLLSKQLEQQGFDVTILTSEDSLTAFEKVGGKLDADGYCSPDSSMDFGKNCKFVTTMASQKTYEAEQYNNGEPSMGPFAFVGSPEIAAQRKGVIDQTLEDLKPDLVVTELWPTGYGPFTREADYLLEKAKNLNPDVMKVSFAREIPYVDLEHNKREDIVQHLENKMDLSIVNGDGSIRLSEFIPTTKSVDAKTYYGGYYVTPLPEKDNRPDEERKVLVSTGSGWIPGRNDSFYDGVLESIPHTELTTQPWEIMLSYDAPQASFDRITDRASKLGAEKGLNITVRRNYDSDEFKRELANAAFSISRAGSSMTIEVLEAGVPAVMNPGIWMPEGGIDEQRTRLERFKKQGAGVGVIDDEILLQPEALANSINQALKQQASGKFKLGTDGPINSARKIAKQFILKRDFPDYQPIMQDYYVSLAQTEGPEKADAAMAQLLAEKYALDVQRHGHDYAYQMLSDFHSNAYLQVLSGLEAERGELVPPTRVTNPEIYGLPTFHGRIVADAGERIDEKLQSKFQTVAGANREEWIEGLGASFYPTRVLAKHFTPEHEREQFMEVRRQYNRDRFEKGEEEATSLLINDYGLEVAAGVVTTVQGHKKGYEALVSTLSEHIDITQVEKVGADLQQSMQQIDKIFSRDKGTQHLKFNEANNPEEELTEGISSKSAKPLPVMTVNNLAMTGEKSLSNGWQLGA